MTQSVLILGSNGRFGFHAARAFAAAGWDVTCFDRKTGTLAEAVARKDVVVNAWNPSDYSKWARELLPMHQQVLDAMAGSETTLILPGNVYVFGEQTGEAWSANTPFRAVNDLGQMRINLEHAYRASGIRTIVLRGGDFLDTRASGNWFDKVMVAGLKRGALTYLGREDIPHAWAFLPDIARAAVMLSEMRQDLPIYADIPFPGYTLSARQIAAYLEDITGRSVRIKQMSWNLLKVVGLVWPMVGALGKMRYLWNTPHMLDSRTFDALLPEFRSTPPQLALRSAIQHLELPYLASAPLAEPAQ